MKYYIFLGILCLWSCTHSGENPTQKKEKLEQLLQQKSTLETEIEALQKEMGISNQEVLIAPNKKVDTLILRPQIFEHFIDLQAIVDAGSSVVVMPKGMPGEIKEIFVTKGMFVKKGTKLLQLEDTLINAQMDNIRTQLTFAKDVLERQEKLWAEKIGSEIEYLKYKNNVQNLENQLETLRRNKNLNAITAPIDGTIDELNLRKGEIFTGMQGSIVQLRIVNFRDMKILVDVPDNYVSNVKIGRSVKVFFPDNKLDFTLKITSVSKFINPSSRSFSVEARLPYNENLRLNLIGKAQILDYSNPKAIVVPLEIIQQENEKNYIYVLSKTETNNNYQVRKHYLTLGKIYGDKVEVLSGIRFGDCLITRGYKDVEEGAFIHL